jgi:hypothetical protein
MEPEDQIARVTGLGRGSLLGFSLILTDQKIVGIDTRRLTRRLWLTMMLGLGLGMILFVVVLFIGLEPVLFRISPLLDFVTMFLLVFSLPIGMFVLVPRLLRTRLRRTGNSTVQAPRKDIVAMEIRKPGRVTEKGYFTVRLFNGTSFTFWTVGRDMFDYVISLLTSFAPGQINDSSGQFADLDLDRPSNRLLTGIGVSMILFAIIGVLILSSYFTLPELVDYIIGILLVHALVIFAYRPLRRLRRHRRSFP